MTIGYASLHPFAEDKQLQAQLKRLGPKGMMIPNENFSEAPITCERCKQYPRDWRGTAGFRQMAGLHMESYAGRWSISSAISHFHWSICQKIIAMHGVFQDHDAIRSKIKMPDRKGIWINIFLWSKICRRSTCSKRMERCFTLHHQRFRLQ